MVNLQLKTQSLKKTGGRAKGSHKRRCRALWEKARAGPVFFNIFILFLAFFTLIMSVRAQETLPLAISPIKQEVILSRGEQQTIHINIFNKGSEPIRGIVSVSDFMVKDTDGTPVLIEENPYPQLSAQSWLQVPREVDIEPNKSFIVPVVITVPEDATPGGHYAALYFQPNTPLTEGSSNVSVRITSLLNIKVLGSMREAAQLSFFNVPILLESGPFNVDFSITNTGDYHINPEGKLRLTDIFGNTVEVIPVQKRNIYPMATNTYKISVGKSFLLGPHKTRLALLYGERGKVLQKEKTVFIFPWRLFLIVMLGLIILYYMSRTVRKKDSSYLPEENSIDKLTLLKEKLKKRND